VSAHLAWRAGQGEPLLLLHGLGSASTTWAPLRPELIAGYDVLAVDLPGHGDAPVLARTEPATPRRLARLVGSLLDELGLDRVHVLGNSLGGWVGLELAADGRARSVTGLAPAGLWLRGSLRRNPMLRLNRGLARSTRPLHATLLRSTTVRATTFASGSAWPAEVPYDVALDAARAQSDSAGYLDSLDGTLGNRFERAAEIGPDVPVTILFGDQDRILPPRLQQHAVAPVHARWLTLPHCGHAPQWDAPGTVLRELDRTVRAASGTP